jgi:hypothetical protein
MLLPPYFQYPSVRRLVGSGDGLDAAERKIM